ncbi:hypothetical protein ACLED0_00380 [Lonsdalea quercina]|uniref:hypothetical protein n=1 Tax=Lonsdalea quercina TaxID=71657 RepID=UPI003974CA4A
MDTLMPTFKRLRSIAVFVERIARKFAPNSRFANWSLWLKYDAEALCDVAKELECAKACLQILDQLDNRHEVQELVVRSVYHAAYIFGECHFYGIEKRWPKAFRRPLANVGMQLNAEEWAKGCHFGLNNSNRGNSQFTTE